MATVNQITTPVLTVENGNWGPVSLTSVRAVLTSAAEEIIDVFGRPPDDLVRVRWWSQAPRALFDYRPYEIRINAQDTYWSQYVYQFSRELCHVMTNFDRCKKHKHKWFAESLCEMASLFVLHRLADAWAENPPSGIYKSDQFAPRHRTYAEDLKAKYPMIPACDLPEWLGRNARILEEDSCRRDLNGVVAVSLLGLFRDDPSLWRDCGWLNHWDAGADKTFSDYLESWACCLRLHGLEDRVPAIVRWLFLPDSTHRDSAAR